MSDNERTMRRKAMEALPRIATALEHMTKVPTRPVSEAEYQRMMSKLDEALSQNRVLKTTLRNREPLRPPVDTDLGMAIAKAEALLRQSDLSGAANATLRNMISWAAANAKHVEDLEEELKASRKRVREADEHREEHLEMFQEHVKATEECDVVSRAMALLLARMGKIARVEECFVTVPNLSRELHKVLHHAIEAGFITEEDVK
jgi:tRNA U34 5-carboxymethylaminomethyl modifying GTPase MnmE/TrmE